MVEEWRTVIYNSVIYEDYEVSNLGNVRSLNYNKTGEIRELKLGKRKDGYLLVNLTKGKKHKSYLVHRVVAYTWIENDEPLTKTQVNHIDENKHNCRVDNLEWCSPKQNANHGTRTQRISKRVKCVETQVIYNSIAQASRETGLSSSGINLCCLGKQKRCGKLHFEYVD